VSIRNLCIVTLRFVEEKYGLELGAAQTTQLSKAIARGEETNDFVLPKGEYLSTNNGDIKRTVTYPGPSERRVCPLRCCCVA
jgi:hypothetical protein